MFRRCFLGVFAALLYIPNKIFGTEIGYHTHTCSRGHTWDHKTNSSHTCQFVLGNGRTCGIYQNVWDNPARPVTGQRVVVPPSPPEPEPIKQEEKLNKKKFMLG